MPFLERQALCINHPPQRAVATCDHCGNAFCDACLVEGLALPEVYCSESCRATGEPGGIERYTAGFKNPFGTGLKLWAKALPSLLRHMVPVAVVATVVLSLGLPEWGQGQEATPFTPFAMFGVALVAAYGVLLTGTILTQRYTGLIRGKAYTYALNRSIPWVLTWFLVAVATSLGYLVLIVPGIIAALRLVWADEFVVAHRLGPVPALKKSWELTRGALGEVFIFQFLAGLFGWVIFMAGLIGIMGLSRVTAPMGPLGLPLTIFTGSMAGLLGYGALHASELAKFYGMRVRQLQKQLVASEEGTQG
ncbi:MAG: hypothetical protein E2O47_03395 [Gemmatimonadetes bacterium]|nr:MAG: hypothetical protein E2O47_03395 [Gemmatimonadota bacterium]